MMLGVFATAIGVCAVSFMVGRWNGVGHERHRVVRLCTSYLIRHTSHDVEVILKCVRDPERHPLQ